MKKNMNLFLVVFVAVSCFLLACNVQESLLLPVSEFVGPSRPQQNVGGAVFTVSPSGNYNDDSYAIQNALNDAVAAGPGSTVQLTAGTFYLKYRIGIDGFDGYFKGAGKQNTTITTHEPVDFGPWNWDTPALIKFRHGYVRMSDLTYRISLPKPAKGIPDFLDYYDALPSIISVTGCSLSDQGETVQEASSSFSNIDFIGGIGHLHNDFNDSSYGGWNVTWAIVIGPEQPADWPPSPTVQKGSNAIRNCRFEWLYNGAGIVESYKSIHVIGGSANDRNITENCGLGFLVANCRESSTEIAYNDLRNVTWSGIFAGQGTHLFPPSLLSTNRINIHHNRVEIVEENPYWSNDAIVVWSAGGLDDTLIEGSVSNNRVFLNNAPWGGIGFGGIDNLLVLNNKISGIGFSGIYTAFSSSYGGVLKGNNVEQVNAAVAPIWLGPGTSNFTVVGGSNITNVWDEGTSNVLTGVNNMKGNPPGPSIKDAMARKQEMMQLFRGRR